MKELKLLFMGTPQFALPSLERLYSSEHSLVAVVTQPDRARGRGRALSVSAVKRWTLDHEITLLQPDRLKQNGFLQRVEAVAPDLIVVVAYGLILPAALLELPPLGCINLHASLLPAYRGAAPIERAIMDGAKETGVTVMAVSPDLDAGDIILQEGLPIGPEDTGGMLRERLARIGARLLRQTVDEIALGRACRQPQDPAGVTYAPPLRREEERLDWSENALALYNKIRALNPSPGAYTTCRGQRLKVWRAAPPGEQSPSGRAGDSPVPGSICRMGGGRLIVACGRGGSLELLELQPAGKKRISAADYCCGYSHTAGERLGE